MIYKTFTYFGTATTEKFIVVISHVRGDSFAAARSRARLLLREANMPEFDDSLYLGTMGYDLPGASKERPAIREMRALVHR